MSPIYKSLEVCSARKTISPESVRCPCLSFTKQLQTFQLRSQQICLVLSALHLSRCYAISVHQRAVKI